MKKILYFFHAQLKYKYCCFETLEIQSRTQLKAKRIPPRPQKVLGSNRFSLSCVCFALLLKLHDAINPASVSFEEIAMFIERRELRAEIVSMKNARKNKGVYIALSVKDWTVSFGNLFAQSAVNLFIFQSNAFSCFCHLAG